MRQAGRTYDATGALCPPEAPCEVAKLSYLDQFRGMLALSTSAKPTRDLGGDSGRQGTKSPDGMVSFSLGLIVDIYSVTYGYFLHGTPGVCRWRARSIQSQGKTTNWLNAVEGVEKSTPHTTRGTRSLSHRADLSRVC